MACNLEVDPATIAFPAELADAIAGWHADYRALDHLWLRGPERYRNWARMQLEEISSPVHQQGLAIRRRLEWYRPAYYWIFAWRHGALAEVSQCPICLEATQPHTGAKASWWVCDTCGLVADTSD
jgi:predicted  nucleic acid-binding Zn ribbon protein